MTGWLTVLIVVLVLLAACIVLVRWAARRWWDYLAVVIIAVLLGWPLAAFTGDVSRYLPPAAFSDGFGGKDQIIIASAASTLLVPLMLAAALVGIVHRARQAWTERRISR